MGTNAIVLSKTDRVYIQKLSTEIVSKNVQSLEDMGMSMAVYKRATMNAIINNPALLKVNQDSLKAAIFRCVERGVMPDGEQAALVPYKGHVQAIMMVRGMLDKLRQWNPAAAVQAEIVYEGEHYQYELGTELTLTHIPQRGIERAWETMIAAWATIHYPGQVQPEYEWMWRDEIEAIRDRDKEKLSGPWVRDWKRMVKKTVLRPLIQRQPIRGLIASDFDDDMAPDDEEPKPKSRRKPLNITPQEPKAPPVAPKAPPPPPKAPPVAPKAPPPPPKAPPVAPKAPPPPPKAPPPRVSREEPQSSFDGMEPPPSAYEEEEWM